ncbi:MAG: hypothetical protein R6V49_09720 [Bacteroidales bacterium]
MKKNFALLLASIILMLAWSCELIEDPDPTDPRDNYTGNWTVNEVSSLYGTNNYNVSIIYDPGNSTQVLIKNFYHFGLEIETYAIATNTSLTVPEQLVCNHTVKGKGTLSSKSKIDWTYTVNDGADIDNVTATFTKQ